MKEKTARVSFAVDGSLGKLAKWLRILGFDALYEPGPPDASIFSHARENKIVLTRSNKVRDRNPGVPMMFIRPDDPMRQLEQVVREAEIGCSDIKPFSRCVRCNFPVREISREKARGLVPDYVFSTLETFHQCPRCERVYWPGTHAKKIAGPIRKLFEA